jgi:hypothetical protein
MSSVAGLHYDDVKDIRGTVSLGMNSTGVIESRVHFTGDEIITEEVMPAPFVEAIMAEVAALSDQVKKRRPGGELVGQLPLPIYWGWHRQWEKGPKLHGVLWRAFLTSKLMDRDYSRFRVKTQKGHVHGARLHLPAS